MTGMNVGTSTLRMSRILLHRHFGLFRREYCCSLFTILCINITLIIVLMIGRFYKHISIESPKYVCISILGYYIFCAYLDGNKPEIN